MRNTAELAKELHSKRMAKGIIKEEESQAGITFLVSDHIEESSQALKTVKMKESIEHLIKSPVEACDNYTADVVRQCGYNTFIHTVDYAYTRHLPLVLDPNHIWLTIAQGFALHVNNNSEQLRHHFVQYEGKELIHIRRDNFLKG